MFGKLGDMYQLKKQADELKKQLADEVIEVENHGVKISMNGNQEVLSVGLPEEMNKEKLEKDLAEAFNDAVKKVQRVMAQKMMSSGMDFGV